MQKKISLLKILALSFPLVIASGLANAEQILIVEPEPETLEVEITDLNLTLTGQEKIDSLINSLGAIKNRVDDGATITVGALGYAALGGVDIDDAFNDGLIT